MGRGGGGAVTTSSPPPAMLATALALALALAAVQAQGRRLTPPLSQGLQLGRSRPSLFRSKLVKNTGSMVFLSLWILNKNTTKGFRKIISGFDQPRLVFFFSCDFSCAFAKFVCKNW